MSTPLQDLIDGAKFRADMQNTDRVLEGEWIALMNAAIRSAWDLASAARPDFQFSSYNFTLTSGGSASVAVPSDFHSLIDVVFGPDTTNEYSLGPFAWQNRRSPGGWWPPFMVNGIGPGGTQASLKGDRVYVEPSLRAGGDYRLWYCPRAHVAVKIVRFATTAALPSVTAAGSGAGKTLTANAVGVLTVDGQTANLNDLILVKDQALTGNNGVYTVTRAGELAVAFVLTRTPGFDTTATITVGDIVGVGQTDPAETAGTLNEGKFFTVAAFTAIESAMTFTEGGYLDPILDQFTELLQLKTAMPAQMRDGGAATTSVTDYKERAKELTGEMRTYFALVRSVTVNRMIDTDATGARGWNGSGW